MTARCAPHNRIWFRCHECLPIVQDDDIPLRVRREMMACAVHNGRISYAWLCDLYRKGRADGHRARETAPR